MPEGGKDGCRGVVVEAQSKSIGPGSWNQQRALRTRWTPRFGPAEAPRVRWGDIGEGSGRLLGDTPGTPPPWPDPYQTRAYWTAPSLAWPRSSPQISAPADSP